MRFRALLPARAPFHGTITLLFFVFTPRLPPPWKTPLHFSPSTHLRHAAYTTVDTTLSRYCLYSHGSSLGPSLAACSVARHRPCAPTSLPSSYSAFLDDERLDFLIICLFLPHEDVILRRRRRLSCGAALLLRTSLRDSSCCSSFEAAGDRIHDVLWREISSICVLLRAVLVVPVLHITTSFACCFARYVFPARFVTASAAAVV